ncbi:CDGSH iron-sulfur domain-containing protein 2 homolog [Planococcus citri]|uniref:CDGSH iron-sulfur domain-containing protein 2 homolog n=1 Tax=Planococcus citri TaxID=170843 RepID=UPI0031F75591
MEPVSNVVKVHLANYLSTLPLPNTVLGWFTIGVRGWLKLIPFFSAVGGVSYVTYRYINPRSPVNPKTKKESPKVVDAFDIEDLGDSTAFCRCWRSSKFPYCDGAHNGYNIAACDNVGPLLIKKKAK